MVKYLNDVGVSQTLCDFYLMQQRLCDSVQGYLSHKAIGRDIPDGLVLLFIDQVGKNVSIFANKSESVTCLRVV